MSMTRTVLKRLRSSTTGQHPGDVARCPVGPSASASPPSPGSWRSLMRGYVVIRRIRQNRGLADHSGPQVREVVSLPRGRSIILGEPYPSPRSA
jgi:hypothetical protein